ncbi:MAG: hypothetical protein GY775_08930, partial [Candidatus Scalindua sp.]|nr:hypothetical protein [Candidatus Scalindua sp.]
TIHSGIPQGSVLSPTLFLLFINDLNQTTCLIHSYADDTTLHYSTHFNARPSQEALQASREEAVAHLASDLSRISDWGRENLVVFNASKTQFLHLSTRQNLPDVYPLTFNNTHLNSSPFLNILGVSFSSNHSW